MGPGDLLRCQHYSGMIKPVYNERLRAWRNIKSDEEPDSLVVFKSMTNNFTFTIPLLNIDDANVASTLQIVFKYFNIPP